MTLDSGRPRLGVRSKFFLIIYPVTAVFVLLFTVLVVNWSSDQREQQNRMLAESISRRDANLLAPVLWNLDLEGRNRILEVIGREQRVRCLRLYERPPADAATRTEIELGAEDFHEGDGDVSTIGDCRALAGTYRVETPIVHRIGRREHLVGFTRHWIDISRDPQDVRKEILGFSLLSLLMYLIIGITVSIGFRRVVFRPIQAMEQALDRYHDTGVREPVSWQSRDEFGAIVRAYNDSVDLQNRTEAQLKAAKDEAETALNDLRIAKDSLVQSEKLASLGSLVAGIAHEINTPVGSSLTVATALEERTRRFREVLASGSLRRSTLDDYVAGVEEATSILGYSLHAAAEQIQKFKQVAVDQTSTQRRSFNLSVMAEEVLSTLRPRIKRTQIQLEVEIDPEITLDCYPGPLGQIIGNLFTNALLHGFQEKGEGTIRLGGRRHGTNHVRIEFSDNGVGMTAEQKKRLYDPFYTTRMGSGGSGLGMHVVYNLVTTVLGGRISVDSERGQGTRIILDLPLSPPVQGAAGSHEEA